MRMFLFLAALIVILHGLAAAAIYPQGDLTGDCKVDWEDMQIFAEQWLDSGECEELPCADFDGLNGINFTDFAFLAGSWQTRGIPLVINEFMASNSSQSGISDPEGQFDDWVEIYNFGDIAIDLGGMYLTDDLEEHTKWQIPEGYPNETTVPADGFILFWADNDTDDGPLHAGFKLDADGEDIGLFADANTMIDGITFGKQVTNISYGRYPDANDNMRFFATPTPLADNNGIYLGIIEDVEFSHERGFYETSFNVTIASTSGGADIYYTTDGSEPIVNELPSASSTKYNSAITIDKTTCLRAAAIKTGWMPSNIKTQTYIFLSDVITQSPYGQAPGSGWPAPGYFNGQLIDYGMDPDVVGDPRYSGETMTNALKGVPTVSLVTDLDNLFDPSTGIWVNAGEEGRLWERPCSIELFYTPNCEGQGFPDLVQVPDANGGYRWDLPSDMRGGFQIDCGMRIRGGWSASGGNPKHAFRLFFRSEYGEAKLRYPLFGTEGVEEFDHMDLRCSQNYSWAFEESYNNIRNTMVREVFSRDLQGEMGQPYTRSRYYHLYVNGQYWGLFQTQERSKASWGKSYMGGDKEDYDVVTSNWTADRRMVPTDGNRDALDRLYDETIAGLYNYERYYRVQGLNTNGTLNDTYERLLDVDNLIDFMIIDYYTGDSDGPGSRYGNIPNNTWGIFNRVNPDGWKWAQHDNEHTLGAGGASGSIENLVVPFTTAGSNRNYFNPHWLHEQLMFFNVDYRMHFADHVHRHFHNDGLMTLENCRNRILNRAYQIDMAIIAESARWGDSKTYPPRTKDDHWWPEINRILYDTFDPWGRKTYLTPRIDKVIQQFRDVGWYPDIDAPVFNYLNGYLSITNPNGSGIIYYTLDGNDPRLPASQSTPGTEVILVAENATKRYLVPTSPVTSTGKILREYWCGIDGNSVSDLISNPNFPDNPTGTSLLTSFEAPSNWIDLYGMRVRGYLHPTTSGSYTFWIASNDNGELWLSTDENPANATLIANVPGWTNSRQWNKYPAQQSSAKSLVAGRKYYIEALMKEYHGADNLAVAWQGPGITQRVIEGRHLSPIGASENWFTNDFNDTFWPSGTGGVGYEKNPGDPVNYIGLFNIDVEADMYNKYTTCYIRIPFTVDGNDLSSFVPLTLRVMFDDGFVAYINGAKVKRDNFTGTPSWNSVADNYLEASGFTSYDITSHISKLHSGNNILAIHGMNNSKTSSDFLISAELVVTKIAYGDISPSAIQYSGGFNLDKSTHVKSRVYKSSTGRWSALTEAIYAPPEVADNVRITEIMYHPQDTNDPNDPNEEYIELKNIGASTINLNLVRFTKGIDFTFGDVNLAAGAYILVVKNQDAFEAEYGTGRPVAGVYSGSLANDGERIKLKDAMGTTILDFNYSDGWRPITDGDGYSLTIVDATNPDVNSWDEKDSWRASAYTGGSPGWDDSGIVPNPGAIVINEVMSHSHAGAPDWIELYNTTAGTINIGGWYLSDNDSNLMKYRIADGTTINSGGYLVFYEDVNFGEISTDPGRLIPFALSENGEMVCLTSALDANGILTGYRQREDFEASETAVSFGRYYKAGTNNYNFVSMDYNTPGQANAYPKVGPIVISEIMYHPNWPAGGNHTNDQYEYIELHNISSGNVTLYDYVEGEPWKFTDGIDYTFPDEVTIPAGGRIVIVKDIEAFSWRYQTVPTNIIYGPYSGWLSNSGEKVELSKPGDEYLGTRYYIRVDRVSYSDGSHPQDCPGNVDLWPIEADGGGDSLTSIDPNHYGNDPNNWAAETPSPGNP